MKTFDELQSCKEVALIWNTAFDRELASIACLMPIWIVDSAPNKTLIEKAVEEFGRDGWITTINSPPKESWDQMLFSIVDHQPNLETIYVYGDVHSDERILRELEFSSIQETSFGLVLQKYRGK